MTTHAVNSSGTLHLLQASRKAEVRRFVYASSSSVYGDTPTLPKHGEMQLSPLSSYAISKLTGEHYCRVFWKVYGLETVALRYFNVFGPRQDPTSQYSAVIPRFILAALDGGRPTIFGDGTQSRDFTYVENVVDANLLAASCPQIAWEVMNVACGERFSLLELLATLGKILKRDIVPVFSEPRPGDVKHSIALIARAQSRLGFSPRVRFHEGLRKTAEWFANFMRV